MSLTARKRIKVTKYFVWQMIFAFLGVMPCIRHIAFLQAMLNNVSYFAQALQVSQIICVFATKVRIKSDKQKNVAKLLADRRFRKMA